MSNRACAVTLLAAVCALAAAPGRAATWYVRPGGTGTRSGASWDHAFPTVAAGLAAAASTDTVNVAAGTYHERINVPAAVSLQGGWEQDGGNWVQRFGASILDGDHGGSVVTVPSGAFFDTIISGFTIRNGTGTLADGRTRGGGVYARDAGPQLIENTIVDNRADIGGGVYIENGRAWVFFNRIARNHAAQTGGGVYVVNNAPEVIGNVIRENSAGSAAGLYAATTSVNPAMVVDNVVWRNRGRTGSGGMVIGAGVRVVNNTVAHNTGPTGAVRYGAGVVGGTFANNVVAFNSAGLSVGSLSMIDVHHNDVYGNAGGNYAGITDRTGQDGNISKDPMFLAWPAFAGYSPIGPSPDDGSIAPYSPCVDAGDNVAIGTIIVDVRRQTRIRAVGVDMGAFETVSPVPMAAVRVRPGGNDAYTGSTWDWPKATVQAAVDAAAASGKEVWVAAGTYSNVWLRIPAGVAVYGGFAGTESQRNERNPDAHPTILESGGSPTVNMEGDNARIDGFTIRGGTGESAEGPDHGGGVYCVTGASLVTNNIIENADVTHFHFGPGMGGGIYTKNCSPTIAGNRIRNNKAGLGGGLYCDGGAPLIVFNVLQGNSTTAASGRIGGGGIYLASNGVVQDNTLTGNEANNSGGGIDVNSGAPTIARNTIQGNRAWFTGAGINADGGTPRILMNRIENNLATNPNSSTGLGGGLFCRAAATVMGNTIIANEANHASGAYLYEQGSRVESNLIASNKNNVGSSMVLLRDSSSHLINNTIVKGEGVHITGASSPWLVNNIIAYNRAGVTQPNGDAASVLLSHNCLFGNVVHNYSGLGPGPGDIFADARFVDPDAGDYHLRADSPCIDAGDKGYLTPDSVYDVDAHPRIQVPTGQVDIGSCEVQPDAQTTLADALHALRVAGGMSAVGAPAVMALLDVERTGPSDGRIDMRDCDRLTRAALGLD